jgi:hypothetical protein
LLLEYEPRLGIETGWDGVQLAAACECDAQLCPVDEDLHGIDRGSSVTDEGADCVILYLIAKATSWSYDDFGKPVRYKGTIFQSADVVTPGGVKDGFKGPIASSETSLALTGIRRGCKR